MTMCHGQICKVHPSDSRDGLDQPWKITDTKFVVVIPEIGLMNGSIRWSSTIVPSLLLWKRDGLIAIGSSALSLTSRQPALFLIDIRIDEPRRALSDWLGVDIARILGFLLAG